jgi:Protein of unknown function (DUF1552)
MRKLSRRDFAGSVGAGLLLSPFISLLGRERQAQAAVKQVKRLVLFCTSGTYPSAWTPSVSGESISAFSQMTAGLAPIKDCVVLVEGMPAINVNGGHGSPDGLTGLDNGYYQGQLKVSVETYIASKVAAASSRPIASLLLGAETTAGGGTSMFYGGDKNGGNQLPTIGSPASAYSTVFGGALPTGMTADTLFKRRQSILDTIRTETQALQGTLGSHEKAKLDLHLASIRMLENKLMVASGGMSGGSVSCTKPTAPGSDGGFMYMNAVDALAANKVHQDIIVNAFACDITRIAAIQYGNDQKLMVNVSGLPYDDEHGGFVHSGQASNFANLIKFENYLSQQFASLVMSLKSRPDPLDSSKTLLDSTIVAWCRQMGDAVNHDMKSMRFVLASGNNGGYLKTSANGRYIKSSERHERILLNLCEAMGLTSYAGFGDPKLPSKTPLPNIAAT